MNIKEYEIALQVKHHHVLQGRGTLIPFLEGKGGLLEFGGLLLLELLGALGAWSVRLLQQA